MLAHFLEREGLPTTQISLIRIHTEKTKPPRALWVPFELGHPFGLPNNPEFQKKVLLSSLKLLEISEGPVIKDFTEDAPASSEQPAILACPININIEDSDDGTEEEKLCAAFKSEMMSIRPWYDIAIKRRERTTVGLSKLDPVAIGDLICCLIGGVMPKNPRQDISLPDELRFAIEDLKAYYFEAITAQPGMEISSAEPLLGWFWGETIAGKALLAVGKVCVTSEDETLQRIGKGLVVAHDTTAGTKT